MKAKYFDIRELVPENVFSDRGEKSWQLIDDRLIVTLDAIRDRFGPVVINTWHKGGGRRECGLRVPGGAYYRPYSQHSFGRAADCLFVKSSVEDVREYIINNPKEFPYVRGVELDVDWLHVDVRNYDEVLTFKP